MTEVAAAAPSSFERGPVPAARRLALVGALLAGVAVAAGAFGAHALRTRLSLVDLAIFETAVRYQFYHALAMLAAGLVPATMYARLSLVRLAGWLFAFGMLIFSGSLYALVLTQHRWLGAITPIGGVALLGGWAALAAAIGFSRPAGQPGAGAERRT